MNAKNLFKSILGVTLLGILVTSATYAWLSFGVTVNNGNMAATISDFVIDYQKGEAISNLPILNSHAAKPLGTIASANDASSLVVTIKKPSGVKWDAHASIWLQPTSNNTLTNDGVVRWAICRDTNVTDLKDNSCAEITNFESEYYTNVERRLVNPNSKVLNMGVVVGTAPVPLLYDGILYSEALNEYVGGSENIIMEDEIRKTCRTVNDGDYSVCDSTGINSGSWDAGASEDWFLINTTGVQYFVYFWLDGENIINAHLDEQYNKIGTNTQYKIGGGGKPDYDSGIKYSLFSGYVFASATQADWVGY